MSRRGELQTHLETYNNMLWNQSVPQDMAEFTHPSVVDVTWQQIVQSEEAFINLCVACHESLAGLGSMSTFARGEEDEDEDDHSTHMAHTEIPRMVSKYPAVSYPSSHNEMDRQIIAFFNQILSFWERIRKERAALVRALQPLGYPEKEIQESIPPEPSDNIDFSLGKWITNIIATNTTSQQKEKQKLILVEAHTSLQYAPNQYHYTRLIGRIFFRYPTFGLSPDMWYHRRAKEIQAIVDQAPSKAQLSHKSLRLLVRAYGDVGQWEECLKAEENVYHQFPDAQKYLLRFILSNYWQVTKRAKILLDQDGNTRSEIERANTEAANATNRAINLLLMSRLDGKMRQQLLPLGLHCLANTSPHVVDQYYDLVDALTRRIFGRVVAKQLLGTGTKEKNRDGNKVAQFHLHFYDRVTIHLLVQMHCHPPVAKSDALLETKEEKIQAEYDARLQRAKKLMEFLFENSTVAELQDVVPRATFHSILQNIVQWNLSPRRWREREEYFQFAMKLLHWMVLAKPWWPTTETWEYLFALSKNGGQGDEVWRKHELCTAFAEEPGLSPLATTKCVLQSWSKTSKRGLTVSPKDDTPPSGVVAAPVQRAWHMFHSLYTLSALPYFFATKPFLVSHLYNHDHAPDHNVYMSVWQICSHFGAWDVARKVYDMAQDQKQRGDLNFLAGANTAFLQCLPFCPDDQQRRILALQVYEEALENDQLMEPSFLSALEQVHPELYQNCMTQLDEKGDNHH